MKGADRGRHGFKAWHALFIVEVAVILWPPLYNKVEPAWLGIPFFYWFQLVWIIVSALLTAVVYFATDD